MNEPTDAASQAQQTETRTAGRGGLFVLGAKVFFIVVGFAQQALLQAAIGLSDYGALARVLSPANIVNNVVVQGSIQGVSRRVAPVRERFAPELRAALRVHWPLAMIVAVGFALAASPIAHFQRAPHIVTPLRVMALVALAYGTYAPLVGALNGRTLFGRQAMLDIVFATLRTAGLVGFGWLFVQRGGSGTLGATIGFALAAMLIIPLAARWAFSAGVGSSGGSASASAPASRSAPASAPTSPPAGVYLTQLASVAMAQLLVNALMQIDLTLVGRFLSDGATALGLGQAEARTKSDEWVGVYRACQLFAFLPYQLVLSVAQVLFPMVARARAESDDAHVRRIVTRGMRIAALLAGGLVAVVATLPETMLHFAYNSTVAARGADTLRVLALGQGAFALFGVASTVLVSLGRERTSALLSAVSLAFVALACVLLASNAAFGQAQIRGAAMATSAGLVAGLALTAWVLRRTAGAFAPLSTLLRVVIGVGACVALGTQLPKFGRVLAPIAAGIVFALYLVVLIATRELRKADFDSIREMFQRRRS